MASTILDKPVKTYLMDAIKSAIEDISQINQVKYGQSIPTDHDTAKYPFACFFHETEKKVNRNRIVVKSFELTVHTFVKKGTSTVDDQMDLIDAELDKKLEADPDILYYGRSVIPDEAHKFIADDWETGMLQSIYKMDYCHAWKNPYELVKEVR